MVLYTPHTLVQFGGTLTNPAEIWSCSIRGWIGVDTQHPVTDLPAYIGRLQAPLKAWFVNSVSGMTSDATLDYVKVNNIKADGHYADNVTHQFGYSPSGVGGTTPVSGSYPHFVTCAATFLTDAGRGRASRGRISLPFDLTGSAPASSLIASTKKTTVANSVKVLLQTVRDAGPPEGQFVPTVFSSVGGEWSVIRSIRVGGRFDTINRRKNAIAEAPYTSVAFP